MKGLIEGILLELGEDPRREGLEKTPTRVESMLRFLTSGYQQDVGEVLNGAVFAEDKTLGTLRDCPMTRSEFVELLKARSSPI